LRLQGNFQGESGLLQPYLKANFWRNFGGHDTVTFAGTDVIDTQRMATAFEIGGGVVAKLSNGFGVFASAGYTTNLDGNQRDTVQGNVGLRASW
jgi:outer membrane autotransporter protein